MTLDNFVEIDLDWFLMIPTGQILHLASGGRGFIPNQVKLNYEIQNKIYNFFYNHNYETDYSPIYDNYINNFLRSKCSVT